MTSDRKTRSNGEASRQRILDAAAAIAGERGYEGTSINLISTRSGLPPSSIYWHFKDKDELIAAVIERSFNEWTDASRARRGPRPASDNDVLRQDMRRIGAAMTANPDFLRLGLMLLLEHRPQEATARKKFIEVRETTRAAATAVYAKRFPDLSGKNIAELVTVLIALADGLFIAEEAGEVALDRAFDSMATVVTGMAEQMRAAERARVRAGAKTTRQLARPRR